MNKRAKLEIIFSFRCWFGGRSQRPSQRHDSTWHSDGQTKGWTSAKQGELFLLNNQQRHEHSHKHTYELHACLQSPIKYNSTAALGSLRHEHWNKELLIDGIYHIYNLMQLLAFAPPWFSFLAWQTEHTFVDRKHKLIGCFSPVQDDRDLK